MRVGSAVAIASILVLVPVLTRPFGRLSSPLALVLVLPVLGYGLEAFGWRDRAAARLGKVQPATARLLTGYALWLGISATLTLDVAAVVAASVGVAVAGRQERERKLHLDSAVLGANVGSLLFPFSNLTNLVLVSASGATFATYVGAALAPQVLGAAAGGAWLFWRSRRDRSRSDALDTRTGTMAFRVNADASPIEWLVLGVAALASVGAIIEGLLGSDIAIPFAVSAGALAGLAIFEGRLTARDIARTVPVVGVAVIVSAALLAGPMLSAGAALGVPGSSTVGLVAVSLTGGAMAMAISNLPAAAFGAAWLAGAPAVVIVAFLVGTNFTALATPHGSVATLLAHSVARRNGYAPTGRAYVGTAWVYAAITTAAALAGLALLR